MPDVTEAIASNLVITRTLDAPRDLVWKLHSQAEHLARWWGPKGLTWVSGTLDFRPGGRFHYCMRGGDGYELWGKFDYREIEEPARIVWVNAFSDASGATVRAPFMADFPLEILNVITFREDGRRTLLRLQSAPLDATAAEWAAFKGLHASMRQGFGGTYDQLAALLQDIQSEGQNG
ncbi:SRPBCC domain-containing protein [Emcibacter sp. SYSU 3D8]|uniref:SRPBCC family protein n=1 Tax=Emcibacter sp. SYSU 3D8 TaxID=3133969 RepID=UPI0031FE9EA4